MFVEVFKAMIALCAIYIPISILIVKRCFQNNLISDTMKMVVKTIKTRQYSICNYKVFALNKAKTHY